MTIFIRTRKQYERILMDIHQLNYYIKIYNTVTHNFIFYQIILGYNSSYMFRPNCRAIFRLIFKQSEDGLTIGPKSVAGIII